MGISAEIASIFMLVIKLRLSSIARILPATCVALCLLAASGEAATEIKWTRADTTGDWGTAGNWSLARVPQAGDLVIFTSVADGGSIQNCTATSGTVAQDLAGIEIRSGYTGTVTFASNFAEGTSQVLTVNGDVTVNGGAAGGGLVLTGRVIDANNGEGVTINCNNFTVATGEVVHANGLGFAAGQGPGYTASRGGPHGGRGGGNDNVPHGSPTSPVTLGTAGGTTAGGGAIKIDVGDGTITVNGTISANGIDLTAINANGGAGGSVWLKCGTLVGSSAGLIQARGGTYVNNSQQRGGGGGRIAIEGTLTSFSGKFDCRGGIGQYGDGQAGTLVLPSGSNLTVHSTHKVGLAPGAWTLGVVTVESNAELFFHGNNQSATDLSGYGVELTATSLTSNGTLSAMADGYAPTKGPGGGASGQGGTHGGRGANNSAVANGSVTAPVTLGSGGGSTWGGGAIKIDVGDGTITVNGTVTANGFDVSSIGSNGGAGGSIWLKCGTLAGNAAIEARGANTSTNGRGGGGGRIALQYVTSTFTGFTSAIGGTGAYSNGEAGSIVPGNLTVADHAAGQATSAFSGATPYADKVLYKFNLTTAGNQDDHAFEDIHVAQLVFDVTGAYKLADADFSNVEVFADLNNNGIKDDAETALNSGFAVSATLTGSNNQTGTITVNFATPLSVNDTATTTFTITGANTGSEQLTITGHGWATGQAVRFGGTGVLPGGLAGGTTYYARVVDANTVTAHTTYAAALAGTGTVDLTSAGSGTREARVYRRDFLLEADIGNIAGGERLTIKLNIENSKITAAGKDLTRPCVTENATNTVGFAELRGTTTGSSHYMQNVWTNGGGTGNWNLATNWSAGRVPVTGELVIFTDNADIAGASTASCNAANDTVAQDLYGIEIRSGYTGTVTFAANFADAGTLGTYGEVGVGSQTLNVVGDVTVNGGAAGGGLVLTGLVEAKTFDFSAVDVGADTITIAGHGYAVGDVVQITTNDTMPGGLTSGLAYHVGNVTGSTFSLHTNITDALAGTNKVNITSQGAGTHTSTRGVGATINCYNFTLASGKVVHSDARGFSSAQVGPGTTGSHFFGATHGGRGGGNTNEPTIPHPYGSPAAITLGSGTLSANGGGAICINASATASISGRLSADAGTGSFSSASGGSIRIVCDVLSGSGEIRTNGGTNTGARAGGGGGRIFISYSSSTYSGTFECAGGKPASAQPGIAGTLQLPSGANLTVTKDVGLPPGSHTFGVVAVQSNATLVMHSNPVSVVACSLTATSVTVDSGSTISANAEGYALYTGPGSTGATNYGGSGHGGRGGGSNPGLTNGVVTAPVNLGSSASHYGGGAIKLVAGSVAINGTLTADGRGRYDAGAGGSIWVVCTTLSGSGTISALGGTPAAENTRGGGGGGRIALEYDTNTFSGTVSAAGGVNSAYPLFNGELGSILPGNLTVADHAAGQATSAFSGATPYADKVLYKFKLTTAGNQDDHAFEDIHVAQLVFDVTGAYKLADADFSNVEVFADLNNNGIKDDAETALNSGFAVSATLTGSNNQTGTITVNFATPLSVNDTATTTKAITGANTGSEQLTITGHGWATGQAVRFGGTGVLPGGLAGGPTYYARVVDANTVTAHTTYAGALAGTGTVDLTSAGSGTREARVYRRDFLLEADIGNIAGGERLTIKLNIENSKITAAGKDLTRPCVTENATNTVGFAELRGTTTSSSHYMTNVWTNGGGTGNWNLATNWSAGRVPVTGELVIFTDNADIAGASTASCNAANDTVAQDLYGIEIRSGYTGTVTFAANFADAGTLGTYGEVGVGSQTLNVVGDVTVNGGAAGGGLVLTSQGTTSAFTSGNVDITNNTITTTAVHGLLTGDPVTLGATPPGGLTQDIVIYYARVLSTSMISLHPTAADAVADTNIVDITSQVASTLYGHRGVSINCSNFTVASGKVVHSDGLGFAGASGPGSGSDLRGAGHAGRSFSGVNTKATYGDASSPVTLGSGGHPSYPGGGAIKINCSGVASVSGTIRSNGLNTSGNPGPGAGGSIYIICNSFTGAGLIEARGGNNSSNAAYVGGGGRIGVTCSSANFNFTGNFHCASGSLSNVFNGEPGTLLLPSGVDWTVANGYKIGFGAGAWTLGEITVNSGGEIFMHSEYRTTTVCAITATNFTVDSGGVVQADGAGFVVNAGTAPAASSVGASHGGRGRNNTVIAYGSDTAPVTLGSGGNVTWGGGALKIDVSAAAGTITINGDLRANGQAGGTGVQGGSAGGSIYLIGGVITGGGLIQANGGSNPALQGGGGGRIAVSCTAGNLTFNGNFDCAGGTNGQTGVLSIPNVDWTVNAGYKVGLPAGANTLGDVVVASTAELFFHGTNQKSASDGSGCSLTCSNLTVNSGGVVSADSDGYYFLFGPGSGGDFIGAAHGGRGGSNSKAAYGSVTEPVTLGSGALTMGGGAIQIICTGTVIVNGAIRATGESSTAVNKGAGAGGSVHIECSTLEGTGTITAIGGSNVNSAGRGGGGGRIALDYTTSTFAGTVSAAGGEGHSGNGELGSILPGSLTVADHAAGQATSAFSGAGPYADRTLYKFNLTTDGNNDDHAFEDIQVTQLVFDVIGAYKLANADFSNIEVFADLNNNGLKDDGETALNSGFTVSGLTDGSNQTGTITVNFASPLSVNDTAVATSTISAVDTGNERITFGAVHGYADGQAVCFSAAAGGVVPTGLTPNAIYYVRTTGCLTPTTQITVHTTRAGALADTGKVDLTGAGSGTRYSKTYRMDFLLEADIGNIAGGERMTIKLNVANSKIVAAGKDLTRTCITENETEDVGFAELRGTTTSSTHYMQNVWTHGTGGNTWNTAGNWSAGHVPVSGEQVIFTVNTDIAGASTASCAAAADTVAQDLYGIEIRSGYTGTVTFAANFADAGTLGTYGEADTGSQTLNVVGDVTVNGGAASGGLVLTGRVIDANNGEGVTINCANFTVASGKVVHADGKGFGAQQGPGGSTGDNGGGHGGRGGSNDRVPYGSPTQPITLGSGGKTSSGGGAVRLNVSGVTTIAGTLRANGQAGGWEGGAGGSLWVVADSVTGTGLIQALGAYGGSTSAARDGGGGRIAISCPLGNYNFTGNIDVGARYDSSGANPAQPGTVAIPSGAALTVKSGYMVGLAPGTHSLGAVTIETTAVMFFHGANQTQNDEGGYGASLEASSFTVDAGGFVLADNDGYAPRYGPARGASSSTSGGHGGRSGDGTLVAYGNPNAPITLGSGGYYGWGGGAIKIDVGVGTATINGTIRANGYFPSGGFYETAAGGSIWIICGTLAGAGTISAKGGDGAGTGGRGGGGGRIALDYTTSTFAGTTNTAGGTGAIANGEAGSIVPGNLTLGAHAAGQQTDQFVSTGNVTDVDIYRWKFTTAGNTDDPAFEDIYVTKLVFDLTGVTGIVTGDVSNVEIWYDSNGDGTGNTQLTHSGTPNVSISDDTGTITVDFIGSNFNVNTKDGMNYILRADVANLVSGDKMTVRLNLGDSKITAAGAALTRTVTTAYPTCGFAVLSGSVTATTHALLGPTIGWVAGETFGIVEGNEGGKVDWNLGTVYVGMRYNTLSGVPMKLKNYGDVAVNVKAAVGVTATSGDPWTRDQTTPAQNTFVLKYSLDSVNHAFLEFETAGAGETVILTGFPANAGADSTKPLALELQTPTSVTSAGAGQQKISLTITAYEP